MGNKRNRKRKNLDWRKQLGQNLGKKRRSEGLEVTESIVDKENVSTNILPENTVHVEDLTIPDDTGACSGQVSLEKLPENTVHVEDLTIPDDTGVACSGQVSLEKLPENNLRINSSSHHQDESDDDTDWYEIGKTVELERSYSVEGRRIIDFEYVFKQMQQISEHNKAFGCTLSNLKIVSETRAGLLSKYKLVCRMCNAKFFLDSESKSTFNLNKSAVSAIISTGMGYTQFNELCAAIDCPFFSEKNYIKLQNEVYDDWQKTATKVMEEAAERERNAAIAEGRMRDGFACIDVIADVYITTQRILAIRKVITSSINEHIDKDINFDTKVNNLYKNITNSYNHAFGNHENCEPYYCSSQKNSEDLTLILKTSLIWHRIKFIINTVAAKARSLMHNSDSNKVESFNNIIAKFVGGKRINFSLRQGYEARCNAAVVSFNTKHALSTFHRSVSGKSPKRRIKRLEEKLIRKQRSVCATKRRKLFSKTKDGDKDYGENCQKPDMSSMELSQCKEEFLLNLPHSEEDRKRIQVSTILQRDSSEWLELRRKLLTASNFAKVVNKRPNTSVKNFVKSIVYPKNLSHVPSLEHGIEHEATATEQLASQLNITIEPCGLFIDKDFPFLGATPDGIVGEDTLIEIKCPITAFKTSLQEAIQKKKVNFWKKSGDLYEINKKHPWYIQVQGQLHITRRSKCIFGVWSGSDKEIKVEIIQKDDLFWKEIIENKLIYFYKTFMLPELCDPRHLRNMPIRDLDDCK